MFSMSDVYQRTFLIVDYYFGLPEEDVDEDLRRAFQDWFLEGGHRQAKDLALYRQFQRICRECSESSVSTV